MVVVYFLSKGINFILIVVLLAVYSAISENLTGHDGYVFVTRSAYMAACVVCSPGS